MALHLRQWTSPTAEPSSNAEVVLLHGFTQNSECWGPFADSLAETINVSAVDAPGHGRSQHDDADLWQTAELVDAVLSDHQPPPILLGYSMGGRTALHVALAKPESLSGLVLVGATAGIDDPADRRLRREVDGELADRLEREPLDRFLQWWLDKPLFAGLSTEAAALSKRLTNRPEGLASSVRNCGTGSQDSLWPRLAEIAVPVLLIVGSQDQKFRSLADRMVEALSGAEVTVAVVEGSHAVHLQQPIEAASAVVDFAARIAAG